MNSLQLRHNDALREQLASEYVLGTLRGGARRRFETWMREDATLLHTVNEWEKRLIPLAELADPVTAPAHVWQAIENELGLQGTRANQPTPSFWSGLRESLSFWRGLGLASTALAAILVAVLLIGLPDMSAPAASYVATLVDEKAQPMMVITGDAKRRQMTVKVVTQQALAADKSLELWALTKEGAPRSLGLVAANGTVTLPLPENATPESVAALAISLEPKGGSPNPDAPSGPVIYKGVWVRI